MTLILSFANRLGVIQVVDRLLTKTKQDISRPFDRQSNKTLIYVARDAVVAISYTGLGYLDDNH